MKQQFHAIRRAYRVACKASPLADGAIASRVATLSALRAFTGNWEDCSPPRSRHVDGTRVYVRPGQWAGVWRLTVYRSCTQFCAKH
jgi:hypothetical protein